MQTVALEPRIQIRFLDVLGFNHRRTPANQPVVLCGFAQTLQENAGVVLGHDCFLPNSV
jgi:hypothetical protein